MASGVNVKIGVSGVAQFKQSMNQAKQATKTLDAQLALTEKQFKATGDSESYMTEKSALLQAKLEQQRTVVANAEKALEQMRANGVERSSTAYQNMYQQMLKAKGEMLDTESAMQGVAEAGDEAANGVSDMNNQLAQIGKNVSIENVTNALDTITDGMKNVMQFAWKTGEAIVTATLGAGAWADELLTTAAQYEISPEDLQRWRKTANIIDTDVDTILTAQDKLKRGREKGDKETMGALAYLGVDPTGKSDMDIFWEAGQAIAQLGKEEDKVSYAQKMFGKSWRELLPLFTAGREEWEETNKSWNVVEEDQLEGLGKMDDQYQKLQGEFETFKMEMLSAFSGPITQGMETITNLFKQLNEYLDSPEGQALLQQLGDTISSLITDLTQVSPEDVINGLSTVVENVTNGLKWISEHSGEVVAGVGAFIAAWAGLEVAKGVTTVLQLINGIKGLTAASAASAGAAAGGSWASAFASAAMKAAPFLAFLYTLLNPASGSDALGNNDLLDANGQLTNEAKAYGYQQDENGQVYLPTPEWRRKEEEENVRKHQETTFGGDAESATDRNERILKSSKALEDLQSAADKMDKTAAELSGGTDKQKQSSTEMSAAAGTLKGMPGAVESAIIRGMSQIRIYIDGQQMSNAIEPHMSAGMAGRVLMAAK